MLTTHPSEVGEGGGLSYSSIWELHSSWSLRSK